MAADFTYYAPISEKQEDFHASPARHRLLIGGYGGGKTYPIIHECFKFMYDPSNNGHEFAVFRNSWDSVRENIEEEMVNIADRAGAVKDWNKTEHNLVLHNDLKCMFRPLSLRRRILKGMNLCGFFCDDPDDTKYSDTISFLYSRLRNPAKPGVKAKEFKTFYTANWEGHTWLWKTFMRDKTGKRKEKEQGECAANDPFAYWLVKTEDNNTLSDTYVSDLAMIHSEAWMDRYVYMKNLGVLSGLVYPELDPMVHNKDLSWCEKDNTLIKIPAVDVGFHANAVLKMAVNKDAIYIYDEWFQRDINSSILGEYLKRESYRNVFRTVIIDPSSARPEQTSNGASVKYDLYHNYGIRAEGAKNDVKYGLFLTKDLLQPAQEKPYIYIDFRKCPNLIREMGIYKWKEPREDDFEEVGFKEEPVKRNDHCVDAMRYGIVYLKRFLKNIMGREDLLRQKRKKLWTNRLDNLRLYRQNPYLRKTYNLKQTYRAMGFAPSRKKQLDKLHRKSDNRIRSLG